MATFVIGDIHGHLRALNDLLSKLEPLLTDKDTIVLLGDYIDRGPDSRGCIDRLLRLRRQVPAEVVALMGNHEDWLLRSLADPARHSWLLGMEAFGTIASYSRDVAEAFRCALEGAGTGIVTERIVMPYELLLGAMPAEHVEFLRSLKLFHRTPDALCSHAGLDPSIVELRDQPRTTLLWGSEEFFQDYHVPKSWFMGTGAMRWLMQPDGPGRTSERTGLAWIPFPRAFSLRFSFPKGVSFKAESMNEEVRAVPGPSCL